MRRYTDKQLIEDILKHCKHDSTYTDYKTAGGTVDYGTFWRRFGTWDQILSIAFDGKTSVAQQITGDQAPRIKDLEAQVSDLTKDNMLLNEQLRDAMRFNPYPITENLRDLDHTYRIGLVSDTHLGSLYSNNGFLRSLYKDFKSQDIHHVFHSGDIVAGENMYRGQVYEIFRHGVDAQLEEVIDFYPREDGITTHFITGNHDLSFFKRAGVDIGRLIDANRPDMHYMGPLEQDFVFGEGGRSAKVRLFHPKKGTSYALSYQPQKYIESLSGGQKPDIVFIGHFHKAEMLPAYRNVFVVQSGTTESQTPFMRASHLAAHVGGWIIEFSIDKKSLISRFKAEFIAMYEG